MKIKQSPLLTSERTADIVRRVNILRPAWKARGREGFYTLGAATYQDEPHEYPLLAATYNPILLGYIAVLYQELLEGLRPYMKGDTVLHHPHALPGFHIFDDRTNGYPGHPHIDEPFKRCAWPAKVCEPQSFTLPLAIPEAGAGLDYWPDYTDAEIEEYISTGALPQPEYLPYELGVLYVHDGLTPHRIANPGDMAKGEQRMTLQGHSAYLPELNQTWLYF